MRLRIFVEPQLGATYAEQLAMAQTSERLGFDAFFRSDHFLTMGGDGLPGPTDSWVTLGALARETTSIRLGTMVTAATFRHPGMLAISVAQVDEMSGGRVELGLGAGWNGREHEAYGVPFPATLGERFEHLEEQLAIVTGLWRTPVGDAFSYDGRHYRLVDSPALPKPMQSPLPIIVGGMGARRTPALAARYAQEYNVPFAGLDATRKQLARVRAACEAIDRDPGEVVCSHAICVFCGADEAQARRRADSAVLPPQLVANAVIGTPDQVVERLRTLAEAGVERSYLQLLDIRDVDHLELLGTQVLPHVV